MSRIELKRRVALAVMAILVAWAPVHYALSRRYRIDHWRFCGFAMYTRPAYQTYLEISGTLPDGPLTPRRLDAALGDEQRRVGELLAERKLWGELQPPDRLARLIYDHLPALSDLVITLDAVGMEPGADFLSASADRYRCGRDQPCTKESR